MTTTSSISTSSMSHEIIKCSISNQSNESRRRCHRQLNSTAPPVTTISTNVIPFIPNLSSCDRGVELSSEMADEEVSSRRQIPSTVTSSFWFYFIATITIALCFLPTIASSQNISSHHHHHHHYTLPTLEAEGKSDKEILDKLLSNDRYDKRLLPPVNGTLTVNVSVLLLSLASPDESSLKYEVEFLLQQQWHDPRLRYANQSTYDFLNAIHHFDKMWLPDTYFIMHGDFKDNPIIPMHFALRIFRNGTINYMMRRHLILSCQGSLNIFPFDDPLCLFSLESISYEAHAIKYVWKNDEDTLRKSPSLTTLNAYLIKNATDGCEEKGNWRGNYSCLKVELTFTRDRAFYFTTVFIPGIILVTSSFITFWLEWNAVPARVMIGVTTMLNFFTTSNGFRSTLPVVSNLTAMNVWDGVCMCFIYASLLEFVCVNYVGRKRPLHNVVYRPGENPVTQRLPAVLSRFGMILASPLTASTNMPRLRTAQQQQPSSSKDQVEMMPLEQPSKPPRQKARHQLESSAEASAASTTTQPSTTTTTSTASTLETVEEGGGSNEGDKRREQSGPNEMVACTSCEGSSPCTHTASNNGCATETCFAQVKKKEPPHPIRVAKTIDVIARITFPLAYAIFLVVFFVHKRFFADDSDSE